LKPIASIIIPAYNVAPYVSEAVTSALQQTEERIEVVVVDDGSVDGTAEQLRSIDDERLRVVRQAHSGSSAARNTGLAQTTAPYVGFLDADDKWAADKLERHLAVLADNHDLDLTFSNSAIMDSQGRVWPMMNLHPGGVVSFMELLEENLVRDGSAVVLRRQAVALAGLFDTSLPACIDIDMWLRIARLRPGNVQCLPEVLTCYRRRPGQISGD